MKRNIVPGVATQLLLQKPEPYAEIAENARIALGILREDGWKVKQVSMEIEATFTVTTVPVDAADAALVAVEQAERRMVELRQNIQQYESEIMRQREVIAAEERLRAEYPIGVLFALGWTALACVTVARLGYGWVGEILAACCASIAIWLAYQQRKQRGAK